jgi:hypothetical protein
MKRLRDYAKEFISKHPHLKKEVDDLVQLCFDEIEEGGSIEHEIDLAIDSIDQLLEEEEDYEDLGGTGHGDISWSDADQGL